jgi:hypothetical protein
MLLRASVPGHVKKHMKKLDMIDRARVSEKIR